jgi:hypothetical protein
MRKYTPLLDAAAGPAVALWRRLGRPLATTAIAIAVALAIIHGESWAFRQAPSLIVDSAVTSASNTGCVSDDAATSALPVAILH